MTIKIGINGFGRIGRMVFRAAVQNFSDIEVVASTTCSSPTTWPTCSSTTACMAASRARSRSRATPGRQRQEDPPDAEERDPANLKWNEVGADIVVEATGLFLDKASAEKHLAAGCQEGADVRRPSKDDTPMFVFGVNHATYAGQAIVSNASCTTNCLAPWPRC